MPSPVKPADFKALISDPTATMCGNFVNTLLKLPVLLYNLVNYLLDSNGNPTKAFVNSALPTGSLLFNAALLTEDGTRLLCDGREFSQTDPTYAPLFAVIGLTYGTPSVGTNFKIPDFRARFPVGIGTFAGGGSASLGVSGGEDLHKLAVAEQGQVAWSITTDDGDAQTGSLKSIKALNIAGNIQDASSIGAPATVASGSTQLSNLSAATNAHNCLPPFLPCYVFIVL